MDHCSVCPPILAKNYACSLNPNFSQNDMFTNIHEIFMVFLSFVYGYPYAAFYFLRCLYCLLFKRSWRVYYLTILILLQGYGSVILKNYFKQNRPELSCSKAYGMPSGHTSFVYCLVVWYLLEYFYIHSKPQKLSLWNSWIKFEFYTLVLFCTFFVPYSRVQLHYHTFYQVFFGALFGIFSSILFFFLVKKKFILELQQVALKQEQKQLEQQQKKH